MKCNMVFSKRNKCAILTRKSGETEGRQNMRTKQAFLNTAMSFLLQLILAVSGIFLPRYFIDAYGSPVNGLVTSINQFITYMSLVEAGIGVAGMVALYKPLADNDNREVSAIVSAAKRFYLLSGLIFTGLCVLLVIFYPFAVKKDITDVGFVRTMIVVLCTNTIVDYFYLGKYRVLLQADQRSYVISLCQIIGTVVMTAVTLLLIKLGFSAILVKVSAAVIYLLRSLAVGIYVKHNYPQIDFNAEPKNEAFDQRWSALVHQIVSIVVFNTDVILLTLMVQKDALSEVSVYGTYNLVAYGILGLLSAVSGALTPSFGNVMARREDKALYDSFGSYEFVSFILTFVTHTCMLVLFYPFITLYTEALPDKAIYLRWSLVYLFTAYSGLHSLRLPAQTMINSAGHYRQTQWRSITEGALNLVMSLILVRPYGIVGVLIGTCIAFLYRTTDCIVYSGRHFLPGTLRRTVGRLVRNIVFSGIITVLGMKLVMPLINTWIQWFLYAAVFAVTDMLLILGFNAVFEWNEVRKVFVKCKSLASSLMHR